MAFFKYDPNQAGGNFELLPEGFYECIISKATVKKSNNGNDMIEVELTVRKDVRGQSDYGGRKIFDNLVDTEKAKFKFHQVAQALGWEEGREVPTIHDFAREIAQQPVRVKVVVRQEEYNGEVRARNRVSYYRASEVPLNTDPFAVSEADLQPVDADDDLPF